MRRRDFRRQQRPRAAKLAAFGAAIPFICLAQELSPEGAGAPNIFFDNIDITNKTVTVAIGQKISLSAPQQGGTESWSVSGSIVGSLNITDSASRCPVFPMKSATSCVTYTSASLKDDATTFYFLSMANQTVSYQYTVGAITYKSTASFNVVGPTNINVTHTIGPVDVYQQPGKTTYALALGDSFTIPTVPGIVFTASGVQPPGFLGQFLWQQTVVSDTQSFTIGSTTYNCPTQSGLDAAFPYSETSTNKSILGYIKNNTAADSPYASTISGTIYLHRDFYASILLAWQANTSASVSASIPVVVAIYDWGYSGTIVSDGAGFTLEAASTENPESFVTNGKFTGWSSVIPAGGVSQQCPEG